MIFVLFKPLQIKEQKVAEVPLLDMNEFVMYELDTKGLHTLMAGKKALRYTNRYVVDYVDFTDNSKEFIANMKANKGLYKNNIVDLKGDVFYVREDGLSFESPTMKYNTTTSVATTNDKYVAYREANSMRGTTLEYNSQLQQMKSKKVTMKYKIAEDK